MPIEQAIFTSAQTKRGSGYHLVCRSHGVSDPESRELTVWGPSHDSFDSGPARIQSVNFFLLASGNYCVSRTVIAGQEYSDRGGGRVYTHCLIVSPADFARFANNPFAVIRAALAAGELDEREMFPHWMEPLLLGGRTPRVDHTLLYRLTSRVAPDTMVRLVAAAFENERLAIVTSLDPILLVAGLVNTLPLDRRPELGFSTGLRYSPQRPFRLIVLPPEATEEIRHVTQAGANVLDFDASQTEAAWVC